MFSGYHFAYLVGIVGMGLPLWSALFYFRKDLRGQMLLAGILLGPAAVLAESLFLRDYWSPEGLDLIRIGLGDFFYGFFAGGIASVLYEEIFRRHFLKKKNKIKQWRNLFLPVSSAGVVAFFVPAQFFQLNTIYAAVIALIVQALIVIYFRRDLLLDALFSGLFFTCVTLLCFLVYTRILYPGIVDAWWQIGNLSGIFVLGIPIEELLFAFAMGMAVGPAYEFFTGRIFGKR